MKKRRKGLFITFEGPEGGGKSTQIKKTGAYLRKHGYRVLVLREPGGTRVSEAVREILLHLKNTKIEKETELLLYLAARAQIVRERIAPALAKGWVVLCDRFEDSTLAYQGFGRGLSVPAIQRASRDFVRGKLQPDLTVVLDIDPVKGMARGGRHDRMEKQSIQFHRRVRRGFLELARKDRQRFRVMDAARTVDQVSREILKEIKRAFRL